MVQDSKEKREKIEDIKDNQAKCHCPACPSYPHNCDTEVLYCIRGASSCHVGIEGCICDTCPVHFEYELKGLYFCDKEEVGESRNLIRKKREFEDDSLYNDMVKIKDVSTTGNSVVSSMGSLKRLPFSLDDLHFIPAQLARIPLNSEEEVNSHVSIGPLSKKPLEVSSPIILSGMSFGAVSKNVKTVIARVASDLKVAFNSGEGGILKEDIELGSPYMIVQYSTGRFGIDENLLRSAAAVEIRFGQGAYPGKGSYLPASKMTSEIARIRGLTKGESAYSPAHHVDISSPDEIKEKIAWLRRITGGSPIGAKIGCGNIEEDVGILADVGADFIALDGFGGGTGATDSYVRENVGIPIIAALPRAFKLLHELDVKDGVSLIAGGGLRSSADFAKCLALGADAVYIGTAALIAINCEQYRICFRGLCPTGVTTHHPQLVKQLNVDEGVFKLSNFIKLSTREIANLTRVMGKDDVDKLNKDDLISLKRDLSLITGTKWLNGKYLN